MPRAGLHLCAAILGLLLLSESASAQSCTSDAQCGVGQYCRDDLDGTAGNNAGQCSNITATTALASIACPTNFGSCTANDLTTALVSVSTVAADDCADGVASIRTTLEYTAGAQNRYDVGTFMSTNGGPVNLGTACVAAAAQGGGGNIHALLNDTDSDLFLDLDGASQPGDTCGDVSSSAGPVRWTVSANVTCSSVDVNGNLQVPTAFVWSQNTGAVCTGVTNVGTGSKCRTQTLVFPTLKPSEAKIEVRKVLSPTSDTGLFNLQINGTTRAANVGNNGSTGQIAVAANTAPTVGETAGTGTTLSDYFTQISCVDRGFTTFNGGPAVTAAGRGPLPALTLPTVRGLDDIVCTITNERVGRLTIRKTTSPASATSFSFSATGDLHATANPAPSGFALANSGERVLLTTALPTSGTRTVTVTEAENAGWALQSLSCTGAASATTNLTTRSATVSMNTANQAPVCTFTNAAVDHGDAPSTHGDARHIITSSLAMGNVIGDQNIGPPYTAQADGDDIQDTDDEDGTTFASIGFDSNGNGTGDPGETVFYGLGVLVRNNTGQDAALVAWFDFNCNGAFDEPSERARIIVDGDGTVTAGECGYVPDASTRYCGLTWGTLGGSTPLISSASAASCPTVGGQKATYARLRLTTEPGFLGASPSPTGLARDGEVEDYLIPVTAAAASTPASVTGIRATAGSGGGAEVSWTTAAELGSVAFRLERWQGDAWNNVSPRDWIPSRLEIQGAAYRVFDDAVAAGETHRYRVVELSRDGTEDLSEAVDVRVEAGTARVSRTNSVMVEERYDLDRVAGVLDQRQKDSPTRSKRVHSTSGSGGEVQSVRVLVSGTGIHGLSAQELADAFQTDRPRIEAALRRGTIRLHSRGVEVPWHEQGGVLYFYGLGSDNVYSVTRTYWLELKKPGTRMAVETVGPAPAPPDATYYASADLEQDNLWWLSLTTNPEDEYWFWAILSPFSPTLSVRVPVPASVPSDGTVSLRLWGASQAAHRLIVRTASGVSLGMVEFSGNQAYTTPEPLTIPAAVLGSDELNLELQLLPAAPGAYSAVLVDGFDVSWLRRYEARGDEISYPAEGAVRVAGFSSAELFTLGVIDPNRPRWISGGAVTPDGTTFAYNAALPLGEYVTATKSTVRRPVRVEPAAPTGLGSRAIRADYVVISTTELMPAARALADLRASAMRTLVLDVQSVYDAFTHGEPFPWALQILARESRSWKAAPRYFVIMGDGSFDYRDINQTGFNFVSPRMYGASNGLFASDTPLGDVDADGVPDVAFGRIPAKSVEEGLAYVAKLEAYEAGIGELPSLLVADRSDRGGDFGFSTLQVQQVIAGETLSLDLTLDGDIASARDRLQEELDRGVRLVNYLGHGGIDRLSKVGPLGLLHNSDVAGLSNGVTPAFVGLSCLINNYSIPGFDSLGERLVVAPDAGMVAVWAASGESYNDLATQLGIGFHLAARNHERLGDALLATLQARPYLVPVYTLLGDPALRLQ